MEEIFFNYKKINNQRIYIHALYLSVMTLMFFYLKSLILHSENNVKMSSICLNTCTCM